jgi:hypothetical protein
MKEDPDASSLPNAILVSTRESLGPGSSMLLGDTSPSLGTDNYESRWLSPEPDTLAREDSGSRRRRPDSPSPTPRRRQSVAEAPQPGETKPADQRRRHQSVGSVDAGDKPRTEEFQANDQRRRRSAGFAGVEEAPKPEERGRRSVSRGGTGRGVRMAVSVSNPRPTPGSCPWTSTTGWETWAPRARQS